MEVIRGPFPARSPEILIAKVKSTYVDLLKVEKECLQIPPSPMDNEQLMQITFRQKTLLQLFYAFFYACYCPNAPPSLRNLPEKYSMTGRLWKHGIHHFFGILRDTLPESIEHMVSFLRFAYNIMGLFYETIPSHMNLWMEYLGYISRFNCAIEDRDLESREIWRKMAVWWTSLASDRTPSNGRLYFTLANTSREMIEQLFLHLKSLSLGLPNTSSLASQIFAAPSSDCDAGFVTLHDMLLGSINLEEFSACLDGFLSDFKRALQESDDFSTRSYQMALSNIATFHYWNCFSTSQPTAPSHPTIPPPPPSNYGKDTQLRTQLSTELMIATLRVFLGRPTDHSSLPHIYCNLVYMRHVVRSQRAMALFEKFPWVELTQYVNQLIKANPSLDIDKLKSFPVPKKATLEVALITPLVDLNTYIGLQSPPEDKEYGAENWETISLNTHTSLSLSMQSAPLATIPALDGERDSMTRFDSNASVDLEKGYGGTDDSFRELKRHGASREDYAQRGLHWTKDVFPENYFKEHAVDHDERDFENEFAHLERVERIIWCTLEICAEGFLVYEADARKISVLSAMPEGHDVAFQGSRCKIDSGIATR